MRALVFDRFQEHPQVREVPDPQPAPDGVVIAVRAAGICRSDWHGWMGHDSDVRPPHVPGHEFAGVVAEIGSRVSRWKVGDRVTVPFCCGCGVCPQCLAGDQQICDDYFQPGFTAWGAFAERVAIRYADVNLVRLPDDLGFVESASLGCRFITSFRAVVTQGRVRAGEWVAVHGCGGVGLSAVQIARAAGAQVIAVDIRPESLALAVSLGATATVDVSQTADVAQAIRQIAGGGAHVSLDALGSRTTCWNSIACLRKRGRHVQVGLMLGDQRDPPIPMGQVIGKELQIIGSHGMQAHAYGDVFAMLRTSSIRPADLVKRTISLDDAAEALVAMGKFGGVGATVIDRFG
ncbi:zinc-dependent alcohol dehydrogenase family protein [Humisphaera borealis]|uniref:Zinc-dependent alcohol dehydrogenase family protein n=1 Tax=Humisphaera borealis TaxID=2807512 RepID=A0A7M2X4C2_9BACT|nr:zinc-dependent alcohol dehydrogenase family protein [Humisphaera borealis]